MLYCNGIGQKDYVKNGRSYKNEKYIGGCMTKLNFGKIRLFNL